MDLKAKVSAIKTKIKDNPDEVLRIVYFTAGAVVATVVCNREFKKTIDQHQDSHNFTRWVCDNLDRHPGEKFDIWSDAEKKFVLMGYKKKEED